MKQYSLAMATSLYTSMCEHAQALAPIESCGYLGGTNNQATTFYPMTNVDHSPEHFSFDPKEQFAVLKQARSKGETLLAVYHSHPETPARLSAEDIRLFNDPDPVYLIVSLASASPVMKGFKVIKPSETNIEVYAVQLEIGE